MGYRAVGGVLEEHWRTRGYREGFSLVRDLGRSLFRLGPTGKVYGAALVTCLVRVKGLLWLDVGIQMTLHPSPIHHSDYSAVSFVVFFC